MDRRTFVIVGAGLAGAKAAESLRGWGFDGRVVVVGDEPAPPYDRPQLSKSYLRGQSPFGVLHDASFYQSNDIELLTSTRVTEVDPGAQEVTLEPGGSLPYDRLLLATGSQPRRLAVPGEDLPGVHRLRTVADADAIGRAARAGRRAVVVGAGWIGLEVAWSLRRLGLEVTVVERSSVPLRRVLGPEVGAVWRDALADHGVALVTNAAVTSFEGERAVEAVRLADGTRLPCDVAVVGIGAAPRLGLARAAGLEVGAGVLVDATLETGAPGIFAAGDVAEVDHPVLGRRLRVEHRWSALTQGPWAAAGMLGHTAAYDWMPIFSSSAFGLTVEYTGHAASWDDVIVRGDTAGRSFVAFWMEGGRVLAAATVNTPGLGRRLATIVGSGAAVDGGLLADPSADLAAIAASLPSRERERVPSGRAGDIAPSYRAWYESCPCCLSDVDPDLKQALDEERIARAASVLEH